MTSKQDNGVKVIKISSDDITRYFLSDDIYRIELFKISEEETEIKFRILPEVVKKGKDFEEQGREDTTFYQPWDIEGTHRTLDSLGLKAEIVKIREVCTKQKTQDCQLYISKIPEGCTDIKEMANSPDLELHKLNFINLHYNKSALKLFGIDAIICDINDVFDNSSINKNSKIMILWGKVEDHIRSIANKDTTILKDKKGSKGHIKELIREIDEKIMNDDIKQKARLLANIRNKTHDPNYDCTESDLQLFREKIFDIIITGYNVRLKSK